MRVENVLISKIIDKYKYIFPADEQETKTIAESIEANGLIQPITISNNFELICGRKRLAAFLLLGKEYIPAVINGKDGGYAEILYHENIARFEMHPHNEAIFLNNLLSKYDGNVKKMATALGKKYDEIVEKLTLINMCNDFILVCKNIPRAYLVEICKYPVDEQVNIYLEYWTGTKINAANIYDFSCSLQKKYERNLSYEYCGFKENEPINNTTCSFCIYNTKNIQGRQKGKCYAPSCYDKKKEIAVKAHIDLFLSKYDTGIIFANTRNPLYNKYINGIFVSYYDEKLYNICEAGELPALFIDNFNNNIGVGKTVRVKKIIDYFYSKNSEYISNNEIHLPSIDIDFITTIDNNNNNSSYDGAIKKQKEIAVFRNSQILSAELEKQGLFNINIVKDKKASIIYILLNTIDHDIILSYLHVNDLKHAKNILAEKYNISFNDFNNMYNEYLNNKFTMPIKISTHDIAEIVYISLMDKPLESLFAFMVKVVTKYKYKNHPINKDIICKILNK